MTYIRIFLLAWLCSGFVAAAQVEASNCTAQLRALGECGGSSSKKAKKSAKAGSSKAERALSKQARAIQRTIAEGVVAGASIGKAVDLATGSDDGVNIGIAIGAVSGTYVAALQTRYARKERRLERVRDDIRQANKELEAAISTMRTVLDLQSQQLADLRARSGSNRKLKKELSEAEANLTNMRAAVRGAEGWEKEFKSTRSLKLVRGQLTGVDNEIAALSARIENMRRIADTLNGAIKS